VAGVGIVVGEENVGGEEVGQIEILRSLRLCKLWGRAARFEWAIGGNGREGRPDVGYGLEE
jgi:hypothetical protein